MADSRQTLSGIRFSTDPAQLDAYQVRGFFVGWSNPPTETTFLQLLVSSDLVELAIDERSGNLVGFATAITDGILSAYLPLLEVLPAFQRRGTGSHLVERLRRRLADIYMIDLTCDPELVPFYERLGWRMSRSMMIRNYDKQRGLPQ